MRSVLLLIESDLPGATAVVQAFASKAPAWQLEVAGTVARAREVLASQLVTACIVSYELSDGIAFDAWDGVANMPSILCVNAGQEARAARGLKIGFHDYLVKDAGLGHVQGLPGLLERVVAKDQEVRRLRDASARLDLALRGADLGFWDRNLVTGESHINERWASMLGYEVKELATALQAFHALVHPDDLPQLKAAEQAHVEGHAPVFACEFRMRHKAQHWVWVYSHGKVMARDEHGMPVRMLGTHMDITERKCAELALRDSEARFRSLTDLSSDWYWEQDEQFRFVRFEGFKEEKAGKTQQASLGTKRWDWGAVNLTEADWAAHRKLLDGRQPFYDFEMCRHDADGQPYWISLSGSPIFDDEGRFTGYRGIGKDVTVRKLAQMQSQASTSQLTAILQAIPDLLLELDLEGVVHECHAHRGEHLSFKPEQAVGRPVAELLTAQAGEVVLQALDEAAAQGYSTGKQYVLELAHGAVWFELSVSKKSYTPEQGLRFIVLARDISQRMLANQAMQEISERYDLAVRGSSDGIWDWNLLKNEAHLSDRWYELMGYGPDDERPDWKLWMDKLHPDDVDGVNDALQRHLEQREVYAVQMRMRKKDGQYGWFLSRGQAVWGEDGKPMRMAGSLTDITERKQAEQALRDSEAFSRDVINSFKEHVAVLDAEGRVMSVNLAWRQWASGNPALQGNRDFVGKDYLALCTQGTVYSNEPDGTAAKLGIAAVMTGAKSSFSMEYVVDYPHDKGWFELNVVPLKSSNRGVLVIHQDITQRKHDQQEIHRLAFHDALTGLPNRRLLVERLRHALLGSERRQQFGAIFFLDLDRFKQLNDTHGHEMGDLLLKEAASRLSACVREVDTVARLGGDEFVVMLENLGEVASWAHAQARKVGEKICAALNQPYELGKLTHLSSASVGFTTFLGQDKSVEEVLKQADTAMYEAKASGRNTICHFGEHDDLFGSQAAEL